MDKEDKDDLADVCSAEEFAKRYPYLNFTRERFEYLVKNKNKNGLLESGSLVKVGRAYYVKATAFSWWYYRYLNIYGRD